MTQSQEFEMIVHPGHGSYEIGIFEIHVDLLGTPFDVHTCNIS